MAKNLDDAIEATLGLISEINGLRKVDNPQERFNIDPFATAFPGSGEWVKNSSSYVTSLGTIILEIHKIRKDLPRDLEVVIPFGELVKNKLLSDANMVLPDSAGNATVDTITDFRWEFGPLGWGDLDTIGWKYEIGIKIEGTV